MNDKRLDQIAAILFPIAHRLVLTRPNNPRAAAIDKLQHLAESMLEPQKIISTRSAAEAVQKAEELTQPGGLICVTGSLYLVGEIKSLISAGALSERAVRV